MNALLPKADIAGLVKVTLFSAYDMKKSAKKFQFIPVSYTHLATIWPLFI